MGSGQGQSTHKIACQRKDIMKTFDNSQFELIAEQPTNRYLVHIGGEGSTVARIFDAAHDTLSPEIFIESILARGYWEDITVIPPGVEERVSQLLNMSIAKYNPDQPRQADGEFGSGESVAMSNDYVVWKDEDTIVNNGEDTGAFVKIGSPIKSEILDVGETLEDPDWVSPFWSTPRGIEIYNDFFTAKSVHKYNEEQASRGDVP